MREKKRECTKMTMNEMIRAKEGVRDKACKIPQDVIRPVDLGARHIVVYEEANSAASIIL